MYYINFLQIKKSRSPNINTSFVSQDVQRPIGALKNYNLMIYISTRGKLSKRQCYKYPFQVEYLNWMPNRPYLGGTKYNCLEYEVIATPTNRQMRAHEE